MVQLDVLASLQDLAGIVEILWTGGQDLGHEQVLDPDDRDDDSPQFDLLRVGEKQLFETWTRKHHVERHASDGMDEGQHSRDVDEFVVGELGQFEACGRELLNQRSSTKRVEIDGDVDILGKPWSSVNDDGLRAKHIPAQPQRAQNGGKISQ